MTNAYFEKLEKLYYIEDLKKLDIINLSALTKGLCRKIKKNFATNHMFSLSGRELFELSSYIAGSRKILIIFHNL